MQQENTPQRRRAAKWWSALAGGAVVGGAIAATGFGVADDKKPAGDKAPPADAKPAFDPKDVRVGPPPELAALRKAVEDAAKKGENVEDVRRQLENLERAMTGKAWVKPKPPLANGNAADPAAPGDFPNPFAADGLRKMFEALRNNPDDAAAVEDALREYHKLLGGAVPGGFGGAVPFGGGAFPFGGGDMFAPRVPPADGRLGVMVGPVPDALRGQLADLPKDRGLVVADVRPGSPADKAGIHANDVIVEFAGKPVDNARDFARAVRDTKAGEKVDLTVLRKGKKEAIKGVELPEPKPVAVAPAAPEPFDLRPFFRPPQIAGGGARRSGTQVTVTGNTFNVSATENGVRYTVEGTRGDDGKLTPTGIVVREGQTSYTAESVDKVPEKYREKVKTMLDQVASAVKPAKKPVVKD